MPEIEPSDRQFHRRWQNILIEFAVPRHVAVGGTGGVGQVHRHVRPQTVHIAIVSVAGPGARMVGFVIPGVTTGIGHRHITDEQDGFHLAGIGLIGSQDLIFHPLYRRAIARLEGHRLPALAPQVIFKINEIGAQLIGTQGVDEDQDFAPGIDHRRGDGGVGVAIGLERPRFADQRIFIGKTDRDQRIVISVANGCVLLQHYGPGVARLPLSPFAQLQVGRRRIGPADQYGRRIEPGCGLEGNGNIDRGLGKQLPAAAEHGKYGKESAHNWEMMTVLLGRGLFQQLQTYSNTATSSVAQQPKCK